LSWLDVSFWVNINIIKLIKYARYVYKCSDRHRKRVKVAYVMVNAAVNARLHALQYVSAAVFANSWKQLSVLLAGMPVVSTGVNYMLHSVQTLNSV